MTKKNDLAGRVAALLSSPDTRPLPERDLAKALHLDAGKRGQLRQVLRNLEATGQAVRLRGGRWDAPPLNRRPVTGTFRVRQNGTCWLIPDDDALPPLWLPPSSMQTAMNGDRIQGIAVHRDPKARLPGAGPDTQTARILRILERKRQCVVGTLQATPYAAYLIPRDPLLGEPIRLTDSPKTLDPHLGNLVSARITDDDPAAGQPVTAAFQEDLGDPESAENDIPALLLDRGCSEEFPEDVRKSAQRVDARIRRQDPVLHGRTDLRSRLILTIDPATAHDYDDAVSLEKLSGGRWKLGVHIADVAAFVKRGSVIDREALRRGNSTYLVDRVIRMLPEDLTVKVCSLQADEDHLAHTVELIYNANGVLQETRTFRSIIRSKACLSYEQVQTFFKTGNLPGRSKAIRQALTDLRGLAGKIRTRRFKQGALDFSLPEVKCVLDHDGQPIGFRKRTASEAYSLIEECMLAANRAVAEKVFAGPFAGIYRIHEEPDAEQWERMGEELRFLGVTPEPKSSADLNRIARKSIGSPTQYITTLTLLRNMKRAVYEAESSPHFGLGFEHYAHFTSPIRRYPDLVLHRILIGMEEGDKRPVYSPAEIRKLAIHCSATERESAEMEIQSIQIKRIRWYAALLARGETGPFEGTVISLNPKGIIVELCDSLQQGMLAYAAMGRERFFLSADGLSASTRSGRSFRLGQSVAVGLASVDEHRRRVDFFLPQAAGGKTSRRPAGKTATTRRPRRKRS